MPINKLSYKFGRIYKSFFGDTRYNKFQKAIRFIKNIGIKKIKVGSWKWDKK